MLNNLQNPWWWARTIAAALALLAGLPLAILVYLILRAIQSAPKAIIRYEYRHRRRTRNWVSY